VSQLAIFALRRFCGFQHDHRRPLFHRAKTPSVVEKHPTISSTAGDNGLFQRRRHTARRVRNVGSSILFHCLEGREAITRAPSMCFLTTTTAPKSIPVGYFWPRLSHRGHSARHDPWSRRFATRGLFVFKIIGPVSFSNFEGIGHYVYQQSDASDNKRGSQQMYRALLGGQIVPIVNTVSMDWK
jgi:hypothetical protein